MGAVTGDRSENIIFIIFYLVNNCTFVLYYYTKIKTYKSEFSDEWLICSELKLFEEMMKKYENGGRKGLGWGLENWIFQLKTGFWGQHAVLENRYAEDT
ncbi:MAG: hypothetical protein OCU22_01840 [Canidatus Methanoxibalbensis ujae]|nr:hypothetical protein [Candidatus Methanoxibalbensis ujae]